MVYLKVSLPTSILFMRGLQVRRFLCKAKLTLSLRFLTIRDFYVF